MYVELRSRIPIVAEQTQLGEQRIQDAQTRAGLSNEAVARVVHVSEKTWRRWKKQGSIPTASLPAVAHALRLELHEFAAGRNGNHRDGGEQWQRELRDEMREGFDGLNRKLDDQAALIRALSAELSRR